MPTEMRGEAVEIITMSLDKFQSNKNYEVRTTYSVTLSNYHCNHSHISTIHANIYSYAAAQGIKKSG